MNRLAAVCVVVCLSISSMAQDSGTFRDVDRPYQRGKNDAITDVPGILVGHYSHTQGTMRGVTAIIVGEQGGTCGVEVRGSNPGTLGVSTYDPLNIGEQCDAIVLTGGSLWGLATVPGVMEYLFEQGKGVRTRASILPVVPAAVIFDLPIGDPNIHPKPEWGYMAAKSARSGPVPQGNVGAGTGGTMGKLPAGTRMKGGLGTASVVLPGGVVVGALVVLNPVGDVVNPKTGEFYARGGGFDQVDYRHRFAVPRRNQQEQKKEDPAQPQTAEPKPKIGDNTTLVVIATNARLEKVQLAKIAQFVHDGLARSIRPIHTMLDGDTVFVTSVGWDDRVDLDVAYTGEGTDRIGNAAADVVVQAIIKGVMAAESIPGWPSWSEWSKGQAKRPAD